MFYVRSPAEGGQEAIAQALSLIWQVRLRTSHSVLLKIVIFCSIH